MWSVTEMRRRYLFGSGVVLLAILLVLVVWQVSFSFGSFSPANALQTFVYWAISTLIFLLMCTLGFMLFRTGVKLYLERRAGREGSRIQFKFVAGALALSLFPLFFFALFSYVILNRNVEKWFSRPAEGLRANLAEASGGLGAEVSGRAQALARWLTSQPEVRTGTANFIALCRDNRIASLEIAIPPEPARTVCPLEPGPTELFHSSAAFPGGSITVTLRPSIDISKTQSEIGAYINEYNQLAAQKKNIRTLYLMFMVAIGLFILFVATWMKKKTSS